MKITAMCYAPLCFNSAFESFNISEIDTTRPNYIEENDNYDRYKFLFTSSMDGTVKCWSVELKTCVGTFASGISSPPLYCILLHPVTGQIFAGADDGTVKVWNTFLKCDDRGVPIVSRERVLSEGGGGMRRIKSTGNVADRALSDYR